MIDAIVSTIDFDADQTRKVAIIFSVQMLGFLRDRIPSPVRIALRTESSAICTVRDDLVF